MVEADGQMSWYVLVLLAKNELCIYFFLCVGYEHSTINTIPDKQP